MLSAMQRWIMWYLPVSQDASLAWEAQCVMALRFIRLASGGTPAQSEAKRIITEKTQALAEALAEAQSAATVAMIKGRSSRHVAKKVLSVYKKRVRRNWRRLTSKPQYPLWATAIAHHTVRARPTQ
jgi:hypothetical protein